MKCYNHPATDAVGQCKTCLKGICLDCSIEIDGGLACRSCYYEDKRGKRKTVAVALAIIGVLAALMAVYSVMNTKWQEAEAAARIEKATSLARSGADQVEKAMLAAIASNEVQEEQFFDANYVSIDGTNPPKYHTSYDAYFDRVVQPILDRLASEPDIVFAVATDRNGYLPTHMSKYSQPLTGDLQKDKVGNRTKRLFNDPIGLAASTNTGDPLAQRYMRDTGDHMADCAVPITLHGKHWGAMRVGVSLGK